MTDEQERTQVLIDFYQTTIKMTNHAFNKFRSEKDQRKGRIVIAEAEQRLRVLKEGI